MPFPQEGYHPAKHNRRLLKAMNSPTPKIPFIQIASLRAISLLTSRQLTSLLKAGPVLHGENRHIHLSVRFLSDHLKKLSGSMESGRLSGRWCAGFISAIRNPFQLWNWDTSGPSAVSYTH